MIAYWQYTPCISEDSKTMIHTLHSCVLDDQTMIHTLHRILSKLKNTHHLLWESIFAHVASHCLVIKNAFQTTIYSQCNLSLYSIHCQPQQWFRPGPTRGAWQLGNLHDSKSCPTCPQFWNSKFLPSANEVAGLRFICFIINFSFFFICDFSDFRLPVGVDGWDFYVRGSNGCREQSQLIWNEVYGWSVPFVPKTVI